jgi:hypothetical protein
MPSLIGSGVDANYRQQQVPYSRFGTRKIAFFRIGRSDTQQSGGVLDMTLFNKLIYGIQTHAEVVMVGAPYISNSWGKFIVAVFEDTFNNGNLTDGVMGQADEGNAGYNGKSETLQDTLRAIADDNDINVEQIYMYGAPQTGGNPDPSDGWATSDTYQEFDLKREFVEGYTT